MAPGQENPLHPPTPQGNQTCPTQRQPWTLMVAQKVTPLLPD